MGRLGRWLWPRRDPHLWQLTAAPPVRNRIILAVLLAPVVGFLELLAYGLALEDPETRSSAFMPTAVISLIGGAVLLVAGGLLVRDVLARRRGALFVAIAGTLLYGLVLLVAMPFSGMMLLLFWPVSPAIGALYALNLYVLLRLLLRRHRDQFWPPSGTPVRQAG